MGVFYILKKMHFKIHNHVNENDLTFDIFISILQYAIKYSQRCITYIKNYLQKQVLIQT